MGDLTEWSWSTSWEVAHRTAILRAQATGFRYRVRRSHARTERWLVMRAMPPQILGGQRRG